MTTHDADFNWTGKSLFSQAGLLTYGSTFDRAFPPWIQAVAYSTIVVPANSAGPTLRIFTAFPFHSRKSGEHLKDILWPTHYPTSRNKGNIFVFTR